MKKTSRIIGRSLLLAVLLSVVSFAPAFTQEADSPFITKSVMIPMRDGVKLNTHIFVPKNQREPLPFLFERTPYGAPDSPKFLTSGSFRELVEEGYIFVFQDIRGRYKSEGQFMMMRTPRNRREAKSIDEATDAYDTIEWLLKNVPNNNGRAGILGISYGGWLTAMALIEPHPALKAASPQASPADMFLGDDFFHGGAFRLSYGFEYATMMETSKENSRVDFDRYDTYEWYLRLGALSNVNEKYLKGKIPTWNDFINHATYDEFWQKKNALAYLNRMTVPTLNVAGWWDQEDFRGPLKIYETLEQHDKQKLNFLVSGPWNHGGWMRRDGGSLGNVKFGSNTSEYFRASIQAPFFAYYLKNKGQWTVPDALTFQTGSNEWKTYEQWPPRHLTTDRKLYFQASGKLSFDAPVAKSGSEAAEFDQYVSDPNKPVPYRPRPIEPTYYHRGSGWPVWLTGDQRFAHERPDVLSWETDTLTEDVTISGHLLARLFASTSGSDSDWVVKLIDVYPEEYPDDPKMGGYQLMIANDVFRARFRQSFEKPAPVTPNKVEEYKIDLLSADHCFKKGHKIMVQVQSSLFPIIDRNPQKFVENIFLARENDYQVATQRIYRSASFASHLVLPVRTK